MSNFIESCGSRLFRPLLSLLLFNFTYFYFLCVKDRWCDMKQWIQIWAYVVPNSFSALVWAPYPDSNRETRFWSHGWSRWYDELCSGAMHDTTHDASLIIPYCYFTLLESKLMITKLCKTKTLIKAIHDFLSLKCDW